MTRLTRRGFLGTSALAAAGLAAGCGGSEETSGSSGSSGGGGSGTLEWADHFSSFQKLNDDWAAEQSSALGASVKHTYYDASKAGQAFQLAHQAKKMPDVYSNVVGLPLAALVGGKWVHELKLSAETKAKIPQNGLTEGITTLDKKLYGFPLFSFRQSSTLVWMNKDHLDRAGLDPDSPPTDYAGFKDACRKLSAAGVKPLTLALGADGGRVRDQVDDLAQAAGFPGYQGLKFATGEYAYHDDSYVTVVEFLKELYDSKYMLPGTNNLSVVDARTRYAAGAVGIFVDGIWCAGGSKALVPTFVDKIAFGPILTPTSGAKPWTYRGRPGATWFVSPDSRDPEKATRLIESLMTEEYQKGMIAAMDQPPLNLDLVAGSDAIDAYKKAVTFCKDNVFLMPQAIVKNPEVAKVDAQRKPITPHVGNIVQGYLGGSIKNLRNELRKLSDASEADREQAMTKAKSSGAKVSEDDYVFADWKPGADYGG
ncbi:Tat (twin-arginine translocation) pathway signal sequence [Actinopolymorpha cephalotaxi]|uniref:ABC-type glycerol-3-phosphate transport system substrate-binding protein n=1 Tax=Actinopolymorpha cephalotaxi TaxID=504797 RepID=A0A1I3A8E1_9ACTN|nr:ABC transporter substrate-binding protein [Actinopolymorpha cephalotaxi]NYH85289.1 ABC-type glycerol-3-phosphate transport system substrate-binding protein [Actinopolymorpha cephalotaxi]SFH46185.1 Tat (twin-arginine translocation) pathway signal sequence [Actinopolymorpha cephalotaxi]